MPHVETFTSLAAAILAGTPRLGAVRLVAIDGHGGSGKSTFAERLARVLGPAQVVHTDDFASWNEPLDWWPELETRALQPLARGETARFPFFAWRPLRLDGWRSVLPEGVVILEGVSSARQAVADRLTLAVWIEAAWSDSLRRGLARDGEGSRPDWEHWRAEEEAHYAADPTRHRADVVVDGAPTLPHDAETEFVRLR